MLLYKHLHRCQLEIVIYIKFYDYLLEQIALAVASCSTSGGNIRFLLEYPRDVKLKAA